MTTSNPDFHVDDTDDARQEAETYRFTGDTPDLSQQQRRPVLRYAFIAIVGVALAGAAVYFLAGRSGNSVETAGAGSAAAEQTQPDSPQFQVMHERIAENRNALNEVIQATSRIANDNAQMGLDLGNVAAAVQQVQLPRLAQNQTQLVEKLREQELRIKRLEDENNELKRNQGDTLALEQKLQSFQQEVVDTRQAINDQRTTLEDTRQLALQNRSILQEPNATPAPADPVIRLAICMNEKLPKPPAKRGQSKPDYSEHIVNVFRERLAAGEMTMAEIEIRLANCLDEPGDGRLPSR